MPGADTKEEPALRRSSRRRFATVLEQPAPTVPRKARARRARQSAASRVLKQKYKWLLEMSTNESAESDSNDSESVVENSEIASDDDADSDVKQRQYLLDRCVSYPDADLEDKVVEELVLPPSCNDLMINMEHSLSAAGVYEGLRCFLIPLRLSPFRFEDFCAAVSSNEDSRLLDEIHISLLRVLLRSDEASGTVFASYEAKDSVAIALWCGMFDSLLWYESIRLYLASFSCSAALGSVVEVLGRCSQYTSLAVCDRLTLLQTLIDLFLLTESARDFMATFGSEIVHEDQCRYCHRLGNLLCCETCSAVYHLECLSPPLAEVPTGTWLCPICSKHEVKGVTDCLSESERSGFLGRHEPLGYDRHGRRYWFLCRRIFVELSDEKVAYYSSVIQFDAVCKALSEDSPYSCEVELLKTLNEIRSEVTTHMNITAELTDMFCGTRKSAIRIYDEHLMSLMYISGTQLYSSMSSADLPHSLNVLRVCSMAVRDQHLDADKSEVIVLGTANQLWSSATIGSVEVTGTTLPVTVTSTLKSLGVILDQRLTLDAHTTAVAKACNYQIRAIRHVHHLLSEPVAQMLACSQLDYCSALLLGAPTSTINKLRRVLAHVVLAIDCHSDSKLISQQLHWLSVQQCITYNKLSVLTRKFLTTGAPVYLNNLLVHH